MLAALEDAQARGETLDLSCLKIVVSSGVIWSQGVKEKMLEWIDATLIDGVGATEGAMALQLSRRGQTGSSARFVPLAETRLFAEDGREIPQGSDEPGLIAAGGAILPAGYYKDPEKTAKTFRIVDGKRFAFIGDWGQWNADGTLQLLGRGSACINTGGEKVYPEEVEHVIAAHPGVADCLVIGMPDETVRPEGRRTRRATQPRRAASRRSWPNSCRARWPATSGLAPSSKSRRFHACRTARPTTRPRRCSRSEQAAVGAAAQWSAGKPRLRAC